MRGPDRRRRHFRERRRWRGPAAHGNRPMTTGEKHMDDIAANDPWWAMLVAAGTRKRVPAGRILVEEGDPGGQLFLITQGEFRAFSCNEAGREITFGTAGPGEVIGEMALDGGPR